MTPSDLLSSNHQHIMIDALTSAGYAILENVLPTDIIKQLAQEAALHMESGNMKKAGTGKQETLMPSTLRGDYIHWVDVPDASPALQQYLHLMQQIQQSVNAHLFLGLFNFEAHFAIYPPNTRYHKHIDQFSNDDARRLSCVFYLNADWHAADGGALRLYPHQDNDQDAFDVLPIGGRMILFLSDQFPHEVLPATRERISLTAWFKVRDTLGPL